MIFALELKKMRRTGFAPIFLGGGLLAGAVPLIDTAVRTETFTRLPGEPFSILMDANWSMMAQLTILLIVCGCCLIYHTEYAERGDLKMRTLPVSQIGLFCGKFGAALLYTLAALVFQGMALAFSGFYWFPEGIADFPKLFAGMGYELAMLLPTLALMLLIASFCQNMWGSLGAGVILTFLGSMIHGEHLTLTMLPFAAPYRTLYGTSAADVKTGLAICAIQTLLFLLIEIIYLRERRLHV
ncbi:MAG: ABC transporter permease subunit [Dorea sp.]|jgi:hypothetical protein|nr:ABC transporter permease subunit [Dorea sp.]